MGKACLRPHFNGGTKGGDIWRSIEKGTPSRKFNKDFGLINLCKELEMSSIFLEYQAKSKIDIRDPYTHC